MGCANDTKLYELHIHKVKVKSLSRVQHFATPRTVAYQAPWSMGFSRQEYWSGLLVPSPGDLPYIIDGQIYHRRHFLPYSSR